MTTPSDKDALKERPVTETELQYWEAHWGGGPNADDGITRMAYQIRRYHAALTEIAHSPHQTAGGGNSYSIGVQDGHRCAATIAKQALGEEVYD